MSGALPQAQGVSLFAPSALALARRRTATAPAKERLGQLVHLPRHELRAGRKLPGAGGIDTLRFHVADGANVRLCLGKIFFAQASDAHRRGGRGRVVLRALGQEVGDVAQAAGGRVAALAGSARGADVEHVHPSSLVLCGAHLHPWALAWAEARQRSLGGQFLDSSAFAGGCPQFRSLFDDDAFSLTTRGSMQQSQRCQDDSG